MAKAHAAVQVDDHRIEIEEFDLPRIGPEAGLSRLKACGVCGTDVGQRVRWLSIIVALLIGVQSCFGCQSQVPFLRQPAAVGQKSSNRDQVKWLLNLSNHVYFGDPYLSPAIVVGNNGTVYAAGRDGLFAISPDGSQKWHADTGLVALSISFGRDGTIYTRSPMDNLSAFNPDGSKKWTLRTSDFEPTEIALAVGNDGTIYTTNVASFGYETFCAINPDGSFRWGFKPGGYGESYVAVGDDGTIYAGGSGGAVIAMDPRGARKWVFSTRGAVVDSIVLGRDGTTYALYMSKELPTGVAAINPNGSPK